MTPDTTLTGLAAMALFGFTGSLHCAAMCGALAASACTPATAGTDRFALAQYHLTRIGAYGVLGLVGGLVTALVIGRWVASAAPYLAIAFGGLMSVYALRELVVAFRPTGASRRSGKLDRLAATLHRSILSLPLPRAVAFGLATALLPCGFLLTALLQASLFAHPAHAALGMMIFAVASSPALLAGSGLLAVIHRRAPRAGPMIAAILLLISSLVVVWRAIATPHDHHSHHDHSPTDQ